MEPKALEAARNWYVIARPSYVALADVVRSTVEGLLKGAAIAHLSVTARAKELDSYMEKIERKEYSNPEEQVTDLAGIRVITFIESDVNRACDLIRSSFNIHSDKSLDKGDELEVDRFGYRSIHFVADLGKARIRLPEYKIYKGMLFEVQVRTVLQHAWAEIEHDRSYKFSGALPTQLRRRLFLIAGTLELADREFNQIVHELDIYAKDVARKTERGELDVELNDTSLREYLNAKFKNYEIEQSPTMSTVIAELHRFGVHALSDFDKLVTDELLKQLGFIGRDAATEVGVIRLAMLWADAEQYFENAWRRRWTGLGAGLYDILVLKYGEAKVERFIKKYNLDVVGEDDR